jgi:threonine/homoserine/homoserine lactone efflux protein
MELAYEGATSAIITGAGCQVLLAGLVLGSYIDNSGMALSPLSLVIGGAYLAWLSRRLLARLRRAT